MNGGWNKTKTPQKTPKHPINTTYLRCWATGVVAVDVVLVVVSVLFVAIDDTAVEGNELILKRKQNI